MTVSPAAGTRSAPRVSCAGTTRSRPDRLTLPYTRRSSDRRGPVGVSARANEHDGLSDLRSREPDGCAVLQRMRRRAHCPASRGRTEGHHGALLRPRRLHRHGRRRAIPKTWTACCRATSRPARRQIEGTAGSSRSSSAMPSWACSGYRRPTRMIRNGPCARPAHRRGRGGAPGPRWRPAATADRHQHRRGARPARRRTRRG